MLSAVKISGDLYLRGPDNLDGFARFSREWIGGGEDECPGESEYARHPLNWNVIKAKFLRDMRTTT